MSLRIAPAPILPTATTQYKGAPSAPGVHDTLRSNLSLTAPVPSSSSSAAATTAASLQSTHPLEARLSQWRATQDAMKMETLRMNFGIAEPIRRGMELKITSAGEWRPKMLGGTSGIHSDILAGRDTTIGWEDVFKGEEYREVPDFHTEMEAKMKMNW